MDMAKIVTKYAIKKNNAFMPSYGLYGVNVRISLWKNKEHAQKYLDIYCSNNKNEYKIIKMKVWE